MSNWCKIRYIKFCVYIYNGFGHFWSYSGKPKGGRFCPQAGRGLKELSNALLHGSVALLALT